MRILSSIMKKILFLCAIVLAFVACKDKDPQEDEKEPKAIYYVKYVMHYAPAMDDEEYKITMHMLTRTGRLKIRTASTIIEETTGPVKVGFSAKADYFSSSSLGAQSVDILVGKADSAFVLKAHSTKAGTADEPATISYTIVE